MQVILQPYYTKFMHPLVLRVLIEQPVCILPENPNSQNDGRLSLSSGLDILGQYVGLSNSFSSD
jgi:hypothetical protein